MPPIAAAKRPRLFSDNALKVRDDSSGGIPRRINQLADLALLTGMGKQVTQMDEALLEDVAGSVGV